MSYTNELIYILQQFGGGKGGEPGNAVVRFLLAAFFWAVLVVISHREWRKRGNKRDLFVSLAALLGVFREMLMFTAEYGSYRGLVDFDFMYRIYPPLEHGLTLLSIAVISFAFLKQTMRNNRFTSWFLGISCGLTMIIYLITAFDWPGFLQTHPNISFGLYAGDLAFRIAGIVIMGAAVGVLYTILRTGKYVPLLLLAGFVFFFLDDALMIINILSRERHVSIFAPIRHNLHIWAIPLLTSSYWSELLQRLQDTNIFTRSTIDSLTAKIFVLDETGVIVTCSAKENIPTLFQNQTMRLGDNYLKACESASGQLGISAISALNQGIHDVFSGIRKNHFQEFQVQNTDHSAWIEVRVTPINLNYSVQAVVSHEDITERKQVEDDLRRLAAEQTIILANAGYGISLVRNCQQIWANEAFGKILGYDSEEIKGSSTSRYFSSQEKYDLFTKEAYPVLESGETFTKSLQMPRSNGTTFRARFTVKAVNPVNLFDGTIWILVDETSEYELKRKLQESEVFLRSVFDQSPISMWVADEKGTLIRANKALRDQLKVTDDEIVGIYNIFDDTIIEVQGFMPQVRDVFDKGHTARFTITYDTSRNTNLSLETISKSVLEVTISPILDSEGNVTNAIIQHLDISELKQLAENLTIAKDAAESANIAKSQFLANMSHEIRTPMNGVLGMCQLLEMTELTVEQREYVESLKHSGNNLLSLISDILDLSKIEAGKIILELAEFSLHQSINDIVLMQKSVAFKKRLALEQNLAKDIPPLLVGDQLRIKQILLNLLGNAVKFTSQGSVAISTQLLEQHDNFALIQIAVRDSGIGILSESLDTIFNPFTQEDGSISRKFGGTGLGLTISLRLAEIMGGTISVESTPGTGSCFTLTLPFTVGREIITIQTATPQTAIAWAGPPLRILFVEDDQVNIKFGSILLNKMGHDVIVAENGRECLAALEQGTFDLVMMDIHMPIMNGEEALRKIRSKEQGTTKYQPVIALTAYSMRGDMERFLGEGFDGYVSKPLITRELVSEMKRVMGLSGDEMEETS
jgi:PAS domain S-box-containing protein